MATRRPRFKPTAILSVRRPATSAPNIKTEPAIESNLNDEIKEEVNNEHATQTARRIIKPSVCLPVRKRGIVAVSNSKLRPDDLSPAEEEAVTLFKSPIMSPSMQVAHNQAKSVELSQTMNSLVDQSITSESEINISQLSPAKLRQRIRPTPWFGNRRNSSSQNGYLSESEDEPLKRQRHLSTSSTHSIHSNIKTLSGVATNSGRMRTESACSILSDIAAVREAR